MSWAQSSTAHDAAADSADLMTFQLTTRPHHVKERLKCNESSSSAEVLMLMQVMQVHCRLRFFKCRCPTDAQSPQQLLCDQLTLARCESANWRLKKVCTNLQVSQIRSWPETIPKQWWSTLTQCTTNWDCAPANANHYHQLSVAKRGQILAEALCDDFVNIQNKKVAATQSGSS